MNPIALYKYPPDPAAFDEAYFETYLPLIEKLPGLERTTITRFTRAVMGEGLSLMAKMNFREEESLKQAMRSSEMAAAGDNLQSFAAGLATLMFGAEG